MNRLFAILPPALAAAVGLSAQAPKNLGPAMQVSLPGLEGVHRLGLAVADVDGDGRRDFVGAVAGRMGTSLNRGANGFAPFVQHALTDTGYLPST